MQLQRSQEWQNPEEEKYRRAGIRKKDRKRERKKKQEQAESGGVPGK